MTGGGRSSVTVDVLLADHFDMRWGPKNDDRRTRPSRPCAKCQEAQEEEERQQTLLLNDQVDCVFLMDLYTT